MAEREYSVIKEGQEDVMKINAETWSFAPSIEDVALCMATTIDKLVEAPSVARIVFSQRKQYSYDYVQTQMLIEIANLYKLLVRQKKMITLGDVPITAESTVYLPIWRARVQEIVLQLLRQDPLGAYVELKRVVREEKIKNAKMPIGVAESHSAYIDILNQVITLLESTKLVSTVRDELAGYSLGDRSLYKRIFRPAVMPDFVFTRLMLQQPIDAEEVDVYDVENSNVALFKTERDIKPLYHLTPPEFKISEDKYALLDLARTVLAEHKPREEEFLEPDKMRNTFYNIGRDLLQELADSRGVELGQEELDEMAKILVRYTVGFGLIEVLLQDQKIQDIMINAPVGNTPIFIVHEDYEECMTNIMPSKDDVESWATKFRIISGRPLDEANPILDTELAIPGARARVAIIQKPLNPFGIAFSLRRHRDKPWTLPLFMKQRMLSPLAAGLLSFLIQGSRSILFAGTRGSGKTSLLNAALVDLMRKYRIITVEDTLELATESLRKLGYNIQSMKVRSALTKGGTEVSADEGIRTSLRMGDSSLIVGEVRSAEAFALYEAMRVGALANFVGGTIHGDSPYGVYDRVVNDLQVPKTSFKATDIIVIANPMKSPDGLHKWRRIVSITEVRKHWTEDPITEKGFVDLMKYNAKTDMLEPTDDLINGDSEIIKAIAGNVKEWAGNWDAVWSNIMLRARVKETLVNYAVKENMDDLLEAEFVIFANDKFHKISDYVKDEAGYLDSDRIFFEWEDWLKRAIKELKME